MLYTRITQHGESIEQENETSYKNTNDKVLHLKNMKQSPLQKVLLEANNAAGGKLAVSKELIEYDKKFFHK
jgi:hypothetical protein